jgi:hypothetical protein
MTRACALVILLAGCGVAAAQEPAKDPTPPPIQDILNNVKKRAAEQKLEDQRRALGLLQRAENSRGAGRIAEAIEIARKAQVLFPESPDIRVALANLLEDQRNARELAANMAQARDHLDEALARAESLVNSGRARDAFELIAAVQRAANLFPAGFDVQPQRAAAEKLLATVQALGVARDGPETVPVVPRLIRELTPSELKLALARRITVEWHDEPLAAVFPLIVEETGVPVVVDPLLVKLGVFDVPRTGFRISNAPVERLLRMVTDMAGASYLVRDGEIFITTKANALAQAVARTSERIELVEPPVPPDVRRRPTSLPGQAPGGSGTGVAALPAKTPEYLLTGRGLIENVEALLRPPAEKAAVPDGK